MGQVQVVRRGTALVVAIVLGVAAAGCSSSTSDGSATPRTKRPAPARNAAAPVGGAPAVAAGGSFTCGRTKAGAAVCWGSNSDGQVGVPSTTPTRAPVEVTGLSSGVASVASGTSQACAVRDDGTISCWGRNAQGVLGDGTTTNRSTPVPVVGLTDAVQVATATTHTCARTKAGTVACWGGNASGALGDGTTTSSPKPVTVQDLTGATDVAVGGSSSCAVAADATVRCWGANASGQLGTGKLGGTSPVPVAVSGIADAIQVAVGSTFACALTTEGAVRCWGANASGQLGDGGTKRSPSTTPLPVQGLERGVAGISAGNDVACARLADGTARCWGANAHGQVGDGSVADATAPHPVRGLTDVVAISAGAPGGGHACAVTADGAARCWGANPAGQLGNDTTTTVAAPATVQGTGKDATFATAGNAGSCAVTAGGGAACWGANDAGQLGTGVAGGSATPVPVKGLDDGVTAVDAGSPGGKARCAIQAGTVWCWGTTAGSLGNGTTRSSATPVAVTGVTDARAVAVGTAHACALDGTRHVSCWGANNLGQLGDGTTTTRATPVAVAGLADPVVAIAAGNSFTCAVTEDGAVRCWGSYPGAAGATSTPTAIPGIEGATSVAGGASSACAVAGDGRVLCWGDNVSGQLGDGTRTASATPVAVRGIAAATAVDVGQLHACALLEGGRASCWGQGTLGQLGNGAAKASLVPVAVSDLSGATAISAGSGHTCALTAAGATCWGDDAAGQVGVAPPSAVPTTVTGGRSFSA